MSLYEALLVIAATVLLFLCLAYREQIEDLIRAFGVAVQAFLKKQIAIGKASRQRVPCFLITDASLHSSQYAQTYYGIALYLFLAAALCGLLASLAYVFSLSAAQDSEKRSEYECGFEPFDSATRLPFDVHFYLVGILFLIFDVEIALLFP